MGIVIGKAQENLTPNGGALRILVLIGMMTGGTIVKITQTPTVIGIVLMIMGSQKSTLNQQITIVTHKITTMMIRAAMK